MSRLILVFLLLCLAATVDARMYQWVDPDSGRTQLSGKPPVWYRSRDGGPRVFVFDNGKLVDDTGAEVTDVERERLRQQALLQATEDRETAREQLLESRRLEALFNQDRAEAHEVIIDDIPENDEAPPPVVDQAAEEETIQQMRALIQEWEQKRTESARGVIAPDDR